MIFLFIHALKSIPQLSPRNCFPIQFLETEYLF